jgi:hypothetical protein
MSAHRKRRLRCGSSVLEGAMFAKLASFFQAAQGDIERNLPVLDSSEHARLVRMRERFEGSTARALDFHTVGHQGMRSSRRGFAHWYLRPKTGEEAREGLYEDVLLKLSQTRNASSLLEYEKMWAQYAIRHTATESWNADPAISGNIPKHLLEQRLELVEKHTKEIGTTYDTDYLEITSSRYEEEPVIGIGVDDEIDYFALGHTTVDELIAEFTIGTQQPTTLALTMDKEEHLVQEAQTEQQPIGQLEEQQITEELHLVPEEEKRETAYSNHAVHWIFEFSGELAKADANRGRHRIRRVVGF